MLSRATLKNVKQMLPSFYFTAVYFVHFFKNIKILFKNISTRGDPAITMLTSESEGGGGGAAASWRDGRPG